jgi:hypothetical protein
MPHGNLFNLTGMRFGRLTVIERAQSFTRTVRWRCVCDCGVERLVVSQALRLGATQSCGCLRREVAHQRTAPGGVMDGRTHGMHKTAEYAAWRGILARCESKTNKDYAEWGGRGITVCRHWHQFENFLADMGRRPSPNHQLDRKDNDGPYCKSNCRWATRSEQQNNTRQNVRVTIGRKTRTVAEWATLIGLNWATFYSRVRRKLSPRKLLAPARPHVRRR